MALVINNGSDDPRKKELKKLFKENTYTKRVWHTSKEDVFRYDDPLILDICPELGSIIGNPKVITKTVAKKDSDGMETGDFYTFKKVIVPLEFGEKEMELTKAPNLFIDGDELPLDEVRICIERYQKESHLYIDIVDNIACLK